MLFIERRSAQTPIAQVITGLKKMDPIYAKRRTVVKDIPGFWPTALFHHKFVEMAAEHAADKDALSYLEDVWVARNESEPRAYKMEFVCLKCRIDFKTGVKAALIALQRESLLFEPSPREGLLLCCTSKRGPRSR